jgi:hypothetical protein
MRAQLFYESSENRALKAQICELNNDPKICSTCQTVHTSERDCLKSLLIKRTAEKLDSMGSKMEKSENAVRMLAKLPPKMPEKELKTRVEATADQF